MLLASCFGGLVPLFSGRAPSACQVYEKARDKTTSKGHTTLRLLEGIINPMMKMPSRTEWRAAGAGQLAKRPTLFQPELLHLEGSFATKPIPRQQEGGCVPSYSGAHKNLSEEKKDTKKKKNSLRTISHCF
jgi:hypothetical protein